MRKYKKPLNLFYIFFFILLLINFLSNKKENKYFREPFDGNSNFIMLLNITNFFFIMFMVFYIPLEVAVDTVPKKQHSSGDSDK